MLTWSHVVILCFVLRVGGGGQSWRHLIGEQGTEEQGRLRWSSVVQGKWTLCKWILRSSLTHCVLKCVSTPNKSQQYEWKWERESKRASETERQTERMRWDYRDNVSRWREVYAPSGLSTPNGLKDFNGVTDKSMAPTFFTLESHSCDVLIQSTALPPLTFY